LDNFISRYFSGGQGRLASPDPGNITAIFHMDDPQTWNGYAYARNNPLRFTDPTGDLYQVCDPSGNNCSSLYDDTFDAEKANGQRNGEYFQNGTMFHFEDGRRVIDGTYQQTDVDIPGDAGTNIMAMGQIAHDSSAAINYFMGTMASSVAGGVAGEVVGGVVGGYISASRLGMLKPLVTNPKLAAVVDELFQATDKLPGGTAGAVRFEQESGIMLSPSPTGHAQDAQDIISQLNNMLKDKNAPGWSVNDQAVAKGLIRDLQNALSGK
jgi:RHS repeat-associated protein